MGNYHNGSSNPVSMGQAFKLFWKNYVNFGGKSSRSEFWFWYLWSIIIRMPLVLLLIVGFLMSISNPSALVIILLTSLLASILNIAMLLPTLSLQIRRLRDAGLSTVLIVSWIIVDYVVSIMGFVFHPVLIVALILSIGMAIADIMPSVNTNN